MNKLLLILHTGVYLPWCMMMFIYLLHYELFHFLSAFLYIMFAGLKWSHMEHFHRPVMFWDRMFRLMEICLIIRLCVVNIFHIGWLGFATMMLTWTGVSKLSAPLKKIALEAPIYCVCLLFFMSSTTSTTHHVASILLIGISIAYWKNKNSLEDEKKMISKLWIYYIVKIIEIYLVFLLEWTSSPLKSSSIVIFILFPVIYSGWAYYSLEIEEENIKDYLFNMEKLPEGYPLPLNFKHAVDKCNVAKKVFKSHSL